MQVTAKPQVVVIVGGSGGIGRETAIRFAEHGAQVVLVARDTGKLQVAAAEVERRGGRVATFAADAANPRDVADLAQWLEDTYGRVDVLIYAAAVFFLSPVETLDIHRAREAMEINYWGAVQTTQALLPLVRCGQTKSIVYVSSVSVQCTPAFFTAYAASKHALRGFALSLRQELRPEGIHVGIISPGPVQTGLIEGQIHTGMYRVPPGVPVLQADKAARQIVAAILRRREEVTVPRRLGVAARLANAFPRLLEGYYRLTIRGWRQLVQQEIERERAAHRNRAAR
jgi:NAD(P)-dependent dehydrogenase (short-subunit alcohol dehydrogenase family)